MIQKNYYTQQAYTILELSLSLTIIAIIFSISLNFFTDYNQKERYEATYKKIFEIEKALHQFYKINGYIPCPAPGNSLETSSAFGRENGIYNTTTFECENSLNNNTGIIPVRSLGVNDEYAYDGWNRKFTYRVAKGLSNSLHFNKINFFGDEFNGDIKIVDLKGIDLTTINNAPPNNEGAAYVIISHGANGDVAAWGKYNSTNPSGASGQEAENTNHAINKTYIQNSKTKNFDDIVSYKTKRFFTRKKIGRSPLYFDSQLCDNANIITSMPPSTSANIDANEIDIIIDSATAVKKLCNNNGAICNFRPTDISDIGNWYDANEPSGSGSTTSSVGSNIITLTDKANSAYNATTSPGNFPSYNATTGISKNGIIFSNHDQIINLNLTPISPTNSLNSTDFTLAFAGRVTRGASLMNLPAQNNDQIRFYISDKNYNNSIAPGLTTSVYFGTGNKDIALNIANNEILNQPIVVIFTYNTTNDNHYGTNVYFYNKYGKYYHENNSAALASDRPVQPNYSFRMEDGGFLGEIISYSRPLNSNERSKLAEYLINKWGNNVCD